MQQTLELPENVVSISALTGGYNGVRVDVTSFHCSGRTFHKFKQADETRLSVVLDEIGGRCEPRLHPDRPNPIDHIPRHMHFAPAGLELWGYTDDVRFVRDAILSFDLKRLGESMAEVFSEDLISAPRLRFADDRIWSLVRLLAEAIDDDSDPSTQLYCDGLTTAIAAKLFSPPLLRAGDSSGLAPWRLRRVIDYLDANLPQRIDLTDLAELAGLSPAHFSRAFKASTGMAPYQWQLDARIRRAQAQLLDTDASLDEVAERTGFADAVHFGRTFRKLTGAAPAAWRRERKS
jgi:AraC-like DNA-binding protein